VFGWSVIIRSEFRISVVAKIILFFKNSRVTVGITHSCIKRVPESFSGVKWTRREVNHSHPFSAEFKNECNYNFIPPVRLHVVERENFTFLTLCQSIVGLFPGVKRPEHVVNHSVPFSAEVKNEWS